MWRWLLGCFGCGTRKDSGDELKRKNELGSEKVPAGRKASSVPGGWWDDSGEAIQADYEPAGDEDVYMTHRKDAFEMSRSAEEHSRMASRCSEEGDHSSAKLHSAMAQEEREAASSLHSKAAKKILAVNNSKNDMWKLDLHGLHAEEAVRVVGSRLRKIETQSARHRSLPPETVKGKKGTLRGSSSSGSLEAAERDNGARERPATLLVITGKGNHSKGQPVLPGAVRGFLNEKGYRYDGSKPGVIKVRPKLRRARSVPN
uniref:Smr domain-containing protein n=1 Tax=Kalanchoe fedtschenkoi TaxID=63787 RepID=A0A7N1A8P1_KALFE